MSGFKEAGDYHEPPIKVPGDLKGGGVSPEYGVRHPHFRLRSSRDANSTAEVSATDIVPNYLHPKPLSQLTLPDEQQVTLGLEIEMTALNKNTGKPRSLYGADTAFMTKNGLQLEHQEPHWDIDQFGLSPEGLKFQAEAATSPASNWESLQHETTKILQPAFAIARSDSTVFLATGLSGAMVHSDWVNISPHTYIGQIMTHGLHGSALDFDACTVQAHVDLKPYGASIEHALVIGEIYNSTLATMLSALAVSAPFSNYQESGYASGREFSRRKLFTRGGVHLSFPIDSDLFLTSAHHQVASGIIPVAERAFGSHNDYRPKLSTGTGEFGSMDSTPNPDLWYSQAIILRRFVHKTTESLLSGDPLPTFLVGNPNHVRIHNRDEVTKWGKHAIIDTVSGPLSITQAWNHFFDWAAPNPTFSDWEKSKQTVNNVLSSPAPDASSYFDPASPYYLHGTASEVMLNEFSRHKGTQEHAVTQTNLAMAYGYMSLFNKGGET